MCTHFYDASVPVFVRYLERTSGLVSVAASHARATGRSPHEILEARLVSGMLPFQSQVEIAANFSLRTCFPLVGQAVPPYGEFPSTLEGLCARLARASAMVSALQPEQFEGAELRVVRDTAGQAALALSATEFLFQYALPNFFFHVSAAYAILRSLGACLGKEQFDGFHSYPPMSSNLMHHDSRRRN
ncbi:DUF1993 domain-containing protein [Noviherbaspirillum sp.]|jgi:hypothetical protein|uniref:DUF1993 domain-containing protein n=1 Tax=Noviherbaspirillum sp. TaxID=1926288 RepID=UPI0025FD7C81|nr:DUF1993 domain-containing protein [Noviherbaspirillum sp.]